MSCLRPIEAWKDRTGAVVFKASLGVGFSFKIKCGSCPACRLDYSRQWAIRCIHEASLHDENSFVTLTYRPEDLPPGGTLRKEDFQLFMKRLRKHFAPQRIRYYHCGEYGERLDRPHYHALLFGLDFPDKVLWKVSRGNRVYTSETLERLWSHGWTSIGAVTFQSAAYCARYIMKKQTALYAEHHYQTVDQESGEIHKVAPEYTTMSLRPGIGAGWFEKFGSDVFPDDFVVHDGKKFKTPRFYDVLYERKEGEAALEEVKTDRKRQALKHQADQTPERLKVREKVLKAKMNLLKRELSE